MNAQATQHILKAAIKNVLDLDSVLDLVTTEKANNYNQNPYLEAHYCGCSTCS